MSEQFKPIKTEYRGVVFDSKSEAIFARCLDMAGHEWVYHVKHLGHVWDFLVWVQIDYIHIPTIVTHPEIPYQGMKKHESNFSIKGTKITPTLIEFKPSPPTKTYIENLTNSQSACPIESIIVWGGPWDDNYTKLDCCYRVYPIFTKHCRYGWGDFIQEADNGEKDPVSMRHKTWDMLRIDDGIAHEAKRYRFDLVNGGR